MLVGGSTDAKIDSAWVYQIRDAWEEAPRSANGMVNMLSILFNFAMLRGGRTDNPCRQVRKLKGGKSYDPWPEVAIERYRAEANPRMVWGMELALHTGQRRGDALAMQWSNIEDGLISVVQQKTRARLLIPIHPDLATVLDAIPRVGTNIVHRADGRAYTGTGLSSLFRREQKRLGLGGLQFHGLRATAATQLAEAGATEREIMSVLGHQTASMVTRYTRRAEQERLAKAAIVKLKPRCDEGGG
ncbi:MAG: tyrosine-type recombinase/integrase [Rhodospirillales bacterium]|nr:tyrosine-type recombinase/integrase [Rhodospirillales bacterium]